MKEGKKEGSRKGSRKEGGRKEGGMKEGRKGGSKVSMKREERLLRTVRGFKYT